jgi:hypothetical protein
MISKRPLPARSQFPEELPHNLAFQIGKVCGLLRSDAEWPFVREELLALSLAMVATPASTLIESLSFRLLAGQGLRLALQKMWDTLAPRERHRVPDPYHHSAEGER